MSRFRPTITAFFVGGPLDGEFHALGGGPHSLFSVAVANSDHHGPFFDTVTYRLSSRESYLDAVVYVYLHDESLPPRFPAPPLPFLEMRGGEAPRRSGPPPTSDEGPGMLLEELLGEIDECLEERE